MLEFVWQDRYGYWEVVEARDPRHAIRKSSHLDDAADLRFATTSCVGLLSVVSQQAIENNNAKVRAGYA